MKKITLLIISIILIGITPLTLNAQEDIIVDSEISEQESKPVITEDSNQNSVKSTNLFFELELVRGTQNPLNKNVPYTLYITPKIDSERTQIKWEVPSTIVAKPSHKEFVNLQKDQTYTYKANIDPQRGGTYEVTVSVIAWQYNVNYTNSVSSTITLSDGLTVQPVDSAYTVTLLLMVTIALIALGGLIFLIYKFSGKIMNRLKLWLTPPY